MLNGKSMIMEKEFELGQSFYRVYYGVLYFNKFFGVKNGRSVWKESFVRTKQYRTSIEAYKELYYLMDNIAPAMGVKVCHYSVESMLVDNMPF